MKYPKWLQAGDAIGVCAPSSGVPENLYERLDNVARNVEALGYNVVETQSLRHNHKCVSADAQTRAAEFLALYENPDVAAIIPPWGGEFLMDMLPHLDFERLAALPPKWVCGYSDITTLTFPMTVMADVATVHGSIFMNMGYTRIHETDARAFDVMRQAVSVQESAPLWGEYTGWDIQNDIYSLTNESRWKALDGAERRSFAGRMIGGCMDTICKLIGTRFAPVGAFLEAYRADGYIWTLESCEMNAADIYRTLWQMRECGWFQYCKGILYGRPKGYADTQDFTLADALQAGLGELDVPVVYDADIGHVPPLMQIVNGAYGCVQYENGRATVVQEMR